MPFDRSLIEAQLAMELIASADMPKIACEALEAGCDGSATRRLAALEKPTFFEVRDVLPQAMKEMGLTRIDVREAAVRIARHLVAEILESGVDPVPHTRELYALWIRSAYCRELQEIGTLNDEVWIRNDMGFKNVREFVTGALRTFLAR